MALKTAAQYKESLKDERLVYYKGEKIEDVTTHPDLSVCVNTMAIDYEMAEDPKYRDLAVVEDPDVWTDQSILLHAQEQRRSVEGP